RAERQPLQRQHPGCLFYPGAQLVLTLQRRLLGGHQAQDRHPVLGHLTQRLEAAGASIVVLEQEALEKRPPEDPGDGLVVALRVVLALIVAAADVQPESHARMPLDDRVVELDAAVDQLLWV